MTLSDLQYLHNTLETYKTWSTYLEICATRFATFDLSTAETILTLSQSLDEVGSKLSELSGKLSDVRRHGFEKGARLPSDCTKIQNTEEKYFFITSRRMASSLLDGIVNHWTERVMFCRNAVDHPRMNPLREIINDIIAMEADHSAALERCKRKFRSD